MRFKQHGSVLAMLLVILTLQSCTDMGNVPLTPAFNASTLSVTLAPGGFTAVTLNGGTPPYTISQQPAANIASATITNNANGIGTLTIQATSQNVSGTTSIKIKDSDTHGAANTNPGHNENEIEITIVVSGSVISFSGQVQPIFTNRCVNAGCHPGGSAPFPLQAGVSYGRLVNIVATEAPCAGIMRVKPSDAANSALYRRIEGTCGNQMPLGMTPLPQAERNIIRDWINQGAANN
ncbi:MAG: hypothetical protein ABI623_02025 [bacterium]